MFDAAHAYDYFNKQLFDGVLIPSSRIVFSWQRRPQSDKTWAEHTKDAYAVYDLANDTYYDEIMFDTCKFGAMREEEILAVLVHEMCHVWQEHCDGGSKGKGNYHDGAFADKMEALGLLVSIDGRYGSPRTGYGVHERIVAGAKFDLAAERYLHRYPLVLALPMRSQRI